MIHRKFVSRVTESTPKPDSSTPGFSLVSLGVFTKPEIVKGYDLGMLTIFQSHLFTTPDYLHKETVLFMDIGKNVGARKYESLSCKSITVHIKSSFKTRNVIIK